MIEKVNPSHPDKLADRIAGAIVDLAYRQVENPQIAVEVLIGHGRCLIIIESSVILKESEVISIVERIAGVTNGDDIQIELIQTMQDQHLAKNQSLKIRCGDNGIFKGVPLTPEQKKLSKIARQIYAEVPYDGKYILDGDKLIICQSNISSTYLKSLYPQAMVNPLGDWTGGINVDSGATNRKLGSDMADSVTGGGLHGKDLSKADVSINIYAFLRAQEIGQKVEFTCAIGDEVIDGKPYEEIVNIARRFIKSKGGFEKLAEWGLY